MNWRLVTVECPVCGAEHETHWFDWCKSSLWHACAVCGATRAVPAPPKAPAPPRREL